MVGTTAFAAPNCVVGSVQQVEGLATIIRQGREISARVGSELHEKDMLQTGPEGSIGVVLNDDTVLSLGPRSALVIDEFVFAPERGRFSIIVKMLKGTAAYLSGLISKLSPGSARFETPSASIGIRGTRFLVKVKDT